MIDLQCPYVKHDNPKPIEPSNEEAINCRVKLRLVEYGSWRSLIMIGMS